MLGHISYNNNNNNNNNKRQFVRRRNMSVDITMAPYNKIKHVIFVLCLARW